MFRQEVSHYDGSPLPSISCLQVDQLKDDCSPNVWSLAIATPAWNADPSVQLKVSETCSSPIFLIGNNFRHGFNGSRLAFLPALAWGVVSYWLNQCLTCFFLLGFRLDHTQPQLPILLISLEQKQFHAKWGAFP